MEEQLIEFETAKLAKEKGLNIPCLECYVAKGTIYNNNREDEYFTNSQLLTDNYSAPTQSLLQRWLREIHTIHIEVHIDFDFSQHANIELEYTYWVFHHKSFESKDEPNFRSYEEALEAALMLALSIIK